MSEIFRTTRPAEFLGYTLKRLAELAHEAEDTDNDVLLIQVVDEIESRGHLAMRIWHGIYLDLMAERAKARMAKRPRKARRSHA